MFFNHQITIQIYQNLLRLEVYTDQNNFLSLEKILIIHPKKRSYFLEIILYPFFLFTQGRLHGTVD
jgi:hypothetical protein